MQPGIVIGQVQPKTETYNSRRIDGSVTGIMLMEKDPT